MNKFTATLVGGSILVGDLAFASTQAFTHIENFQTQPVMEQNEVIAAINELFQSNGAMVEGVTQGTINAVCQLVEKNITDVYIKQSMQNIIQHAQALLDASQVM